MTDARLSNSLPTSNGGRQTIKLTPSANTGTWVATLSDGSTVVENQGEWVVREGESTPWVRLTHFLGDNDLHLTSLRLNFNGRTVHLPRPSFDKFGYAEIAKEPLYYSLSYHVEAEMDMSGGLVDQTLFMDLAAHYPNDQALHYIQDMTGGNNSWVVLTEGHQPLASTPRRKND
jgi:hypothetical protein